MPASRHATATTTSVSGIARLGFEQVRSAAAGRTRTRLPARRTSPSTTSVRPCRSTPPSTADWLAPSAIRRPNSCVRCATDVAITPPTPASVTSSASPANSAKQQRRQPRRGQVAAAQLGRASGCSRRADSGRSSARRRGRPRPSPAGRRWSARARDRAGRCGVWLSAVYTCASVSELSPRCLTSSTTPTTLQPGLATVERHARADGTGAVPLARHRAVDDGHSRLVACVGGLERSALQHAHGQRVEVAGADGEVVRDRTLVGIVDGAPLDLERVRERLGGGQRHGAGDGHRRHARLVRTGARGAARRAAGSRRRSGSARSCRTPRPTARARPDSPSARSADDGGWTAAGRRRPAARPTRPPARSPGPAAGAGVADPGRRPRPA